MTDHKDAGPSERSVYERTGLPEVATIAKLGAGDSARLIADCELAAKVLADTNTFETGQSILREAAAKLAAMTAQVAELTRLTNGQEEIIETQGNTIIRINNRNEGLTARVARLEGAGDERPDAPAHIVEYTNYRGETARRCIIPIRMWWGSTEWHPEEQWMLTAWDLDKNASRDFAWQDMRPVQNGATSSAIAALTDGGKDEA